MANRLPKNIYSAIIENGDTIPVVQLVDVYVFPPRVFKNAREERYYWRDVNDVKKTLPFAKIVYATLIETYEYIETLPTTEEKEKHLKRMEKEIFAEYMPQLKKLNIRQGKLLIKLIDRECNQSSYQLIKSFLGGFRAGFWQMFGSIFGASLKSDWDPTGDDAETEMICRMVESGAL